MQNKTYLTSAFYVLFLAYLLHFIIEKPILNFLALYSNIGIYFSATVILTYCLIHISRKINFFNKPKLFIINNPGILLAICLILSHVFSIYSPLIIFVNTVSLFLHINTYLIYFTIGLLFFSLGAFLLDKYDKKMIFISMGILFVYGVYYFLSWTSLAEQRNIYIKTYSIAAINNINLKECNVTILCTNIDTKNFYTLNPKIENQPIEFHNKVSLYLNDFSKKINNSNRKIVTFSYLDNLTTFLDSQYMPIGVYNKETNFLIIDYTSFNRIQQNGVSFYNKIVGTSSFLWMLFLNVLIFLHFIIKIKMKNKVSKNDFK